MAKRLISILAVICFCITLTILAGFIIIQHIFTSEGYHHIGHWHHFFFVGKGVVYDAREKEFLEDVDLYINEYQKDTEVLKSGKFYIEGFLDTDELKNSFTTNVYYTITPWFYSISGELPGIQLEIRRCEITDVRDKPFSTEKCYPEAFMQYDKDSQITTIALAYAECKSDIRYVIVYGTDSYEEALQYITQSGY